MRRSVSASVLPSGPMVSKQLPGSSLGHPRRTPSWAGPEWRRSRERDSVWESASSFFWVRLITMICILVGCLFFGGEQPEINDKLDVRTMALSPESCGAALQSPKMALLFLLKGPLYHRDMWESWLERAAGLLPAEHLSLGMCDRRDDDVGLSPAYIIDACSRSRQHLFSVYVHMSKELDIDELLEPQWRLYSYNLTRVVTKWGHHSLVEATRNLLAKAFEDPMNERFVLLSETHIPLWDPLTLFRVAMNEKHSSINAYYHEDMDVERWTKKMEPVVPKENWRKSQQWWTLIRSHVELILRDTEVFKVFQEHCIWEMEIGFERLHHRKCYSDEHYFATLLSIKNVEDETVPFFATTTYVEWPAGAAHPRSFLPEEVTSELLKKTLRGHEPCPLSLYDQDVLTQTSRESFVDVSVLEGGNLDAICGVVQSQGRYAKQATLPPACTTFARKFEEATVDAVHSLLETEMIIEIK